MREILFRGRNSDGEWFEGSYHIQDGERLKDGTKKMEHRILGLRGECEYVDPKTVGQYTGLKDKNGKRIFEGDIVRFERFGSWHTGKVVFNPRTAGFEVWWEIIVGAYGEKATRTMNMAGSAFYKEIIGNIHDNPELLKEDK